jgi:hypothetical protein
MNDAHAGVTLHIDENITNSERERFRDVLLELDGVMAAAYHDERPHLMVIIFDPAVIKSIEFVKEARNIGLHAELIP